MKNRTTEVEFTFLMELTPDMLLDSEFNRGTIVVERADWNSIINIPLPVTADNEVYLLTQDAPLASLQVTFDLTTPNRDSYYQQDLFLRVCTIRAPHY